MLVYKYFYMYNYPLLSLPPLPPHSLILSTATQQRHPMLVYIYIYMNKYTLPPLPPLSPHSLLLPTAT